MTMSTLLEKVGEKDFGRPHQSYLVNFRYVCAIVKDEVLLRDCDVHIPLSRSCKIDFKLSYMEYVEKSLCV